MKLQLDLAKQIADSKYAEEFYPYTSIATLFISNFENYEEQIKSSFIGVNYLGNQLFEITYSDNSYQGYNTLKQHCHQSQVFSLLESLIIRMKAGRNEP